jgi:bacterioferritin
MSNSFALDLTKIRRRAREQMKAGAVTRANTTDVVRVVDVLNQALATEIVCVLRYKNHYYMARGTRGQIVAEELLEHATEEQRHADQLAERIVQLGGIPRFDPEGLATRSHTEYREGDSLRQMVCEDLVAERIAVETYTEMIRWIGEGDPTTRRVLESILESEEEHADDLAELLEDL